MKRRGGGRRRTRDRKIGTGRRREEEKEEEEDEEEEEEKEESSRSSPIAQRNILPTSSRLQSKLSRKPSRSRLQQNVFQKSVNVYQTAPCHIPEDSCCVL